MQQTTSTDCFNQEFLERGLPPSAAPRPYSIDCFLSGAMFFKIQNNFVLESNRFNRFLSLQESSECALEPSRREYEKGCFSN